MSKGPLHRELKIWGETMEVRMGQLICPGVEVTLDVGSCKLYAMAVRLKKNLHQDHRIIGIFFALSLRME